MTSFLTALPSTPFAIAMPDEFSDATDSYRRQEEPDFNKSDNAIGEYKASECPNWLDNRIKGVNSSDFLPDSIAIYTVCTAMPDKSSDVIDIMVNRRNSISTSPMT